MALRVLRGGALPVLLVLAVLGLSAAGSAQSDPFVGTWTSVDTRDNSNQRMTITRQGATYGIELFDDLASICTGGGSGTGKGTATLSGDTISGLITLTCATGQVFADVPFTLTYRKASDTLIDGLGVVWLRVKPPPPPPKPRPKPGTGSLPLGRLVLTSGEAPGLKARPVKRSAAKAVLADAVRPGKPPRIAAAVTQIARFGRGSIQVTSVAFVLKAPAAAKSTARAIGRAGRGSRVSLGNSGFALHRKRTAVAWYRGRIVCLLLFEMAEQKRSIRSKVALDYGRTADARVERALTKTAVDRVLSSVSPKGELSRKAALGLFALAFAPLPGTKLPVGQAEVIPSGTPAVRNILRIWKSLTPAQRTAAARLIGVNGVVLPGTRWLAGRRHPAEYGDPNFTPDVAMTQLAKQFAAVYQQKTGVQLKLEIVAGPGSPAPGAAAYAIPLDDKGDYTAKPTICRVTMAPPGLEEDATGQTRIIAHEVFHCMQFAMVGATSWAAGKFGDWVGQGTADWAAFKVTGVPWSYAYSFQKYLNTCDTTQLYARVDNSAVGFFGHTDDAVEDFWTRVEPVVFLGFKYGSDAAYEAARGNEDIFLDTWAASALIAPAYGLAWTSSSPLKPAFGSGCPTVEIVGSTDVESTPLTTRLYYIENMDYVDLPLLHVEITKGHGRIGDAQFVDTVVKDAWFCVKGDCACPEGTVGIPPPSPSLKRPAILGLTGGRTAGQGRVTYVSLKEFCQTPQPLPDPPSPHTGGGSSPPGPGDTSHPKEDAPEPLQCYGHGCAHSAADPHLLPFDAPWYDFQGVGEFTLIRSTTDDLEVQVRQQPWPGSKVVAQNVAVAMRVAGDRVGIYHGDPLVVRVNGRPVLLGKKSIRLPGGGTITPLRQRQVDVVWPDASAVRVIPTGDLSTDFVVSLADARQGNVRGLLGNDDRNGNDDDDFTTRGGRRLDAEAVRGTGKRAYTLLYRVFGESWRISQKASLFDYAPGQSTRTFTDRRFPARIASPEQLEAKRRKQAEAVCRRMRLRSGLVFRNCVLDVASTGFFSFAVSASTAERSAKKARKSPKPPPPAKPGATVRWAGKTYTYRPSGGQDGCDTVDKTIRFSVQFTTSPGRKVVYGFKLIVTKGTKDGTYTSGTGAVFEIENRTLVEIQNLTVKLAGLRTRGTFSGNASTPGKEPVTGSFTC